MYVGAREDLELRALCPVEERNQEIMGTPWTSRESVSWGIRPQEDLGGSEGGLS